MYDLKINFEDYDFLKNLEVPYTHSLYSFIKALQLFIDRSVESNASEVSIKFDLSHEKLQVFLKDNGSSFIDSSLSYKELVEQMAKGQIETIIETVEEGNTIRLDVPLSVL